VKWAFVEFGSLCKLQNGKAFKPSDWSNEGLPIVRIQNLNNEKKPFNHCNFNVEKRFLINSGDLLFSWSGTPGTSFGAFYWNRGSAVLNQHIFRVDLNETIVRKDYLKLAINSKLNEIISKAHGGVGLKHITKGNLEAIKIPLPPLPVQKQIAAVLEKADTLRQQCQQMEQELNALAQSVFLDMFGDPVANPKRWDCDNLGNLAEVKGGLQVTHRRSVNPIEIPYLRVANVHRDRLELDEVKKIRVTQNELDRTKMFKGDMLVVEGHGNKLEIGRCAIWDGSIENCTHQNHLIRVRFNLQKLSPYFVSCYLNSEGGRLQILSFSKTTSGLNTISTNNVRSLKLIVPPTEIQEKFLAIYHNIQVKIQDCKKLQILHEEEFNSLMQRAFKGELDLKDVA
jgi:type I restriction enzyme S subunit